MLDGITIDKYGVTQPKNVISKLLLIIKII